MSHVHLTRTRTREHTPDYATYYSRPLNHSDSKSQRKITLSDVSDDGNDDYPYSSSHKPLRTTSYTLAFRDQPSQLERYNIWSDRCDTHSDDNDDDHRRRSHEHRRVYKYITSPTHRHDSKDKLYDSAQPNFQLKVQAKFARPNTSHRHHETTAFWPTDILRRKEEWVDEDWELRERSSSRERRRRDSPWSDDVEGKEAEGKEESWSRYRRVKSTKTEEVRPLSGWRRNRIVFGS